MVKYQQCYDETHPRTDCMNKDSGKGCVEKGMGGHPGAFTDVQLQDCSIACGKKATKDSKTELAFYDDLYTRDNLPNNLEALKKVYYMIAKILKNSNKYLRDIGFISDYKNCDEYIGKSKCINE